jgi:transposase
VVPGNLEPQRGSAPPQDETLGRSRGGLSSKLHLRVEGGGRPLAILVTAGQRHEAPLQPALLDAGAVRRSGPAGRPGRGRPRKRPERLAADKGYSYPSVRAELRRRRIGAVIPTRTNQRRRPRFDRAVYAERNRVERCVNRLKQFRRVATRYEKRACNLSGAETHACR